MQILGSTGNGELQRRKTAIGHGDLDQNIFDVGFGIFREHIEIAVFREHAGIQQLKFGIFPRAFIILVD